MVFVLDCSGSMTDPARGRLAQIAVPVVAAPPPPPVPQPPPPPPPQPGDPAVIPGYSDPPLTTSPPLTSPPPMRPEEQTPPPIVQPAPAPAPVLPRKFDIAQAELIDAVRQLPDGTRINVIFFNSDLQAVATELVTLQANDRDPLVAFIMDRVATGSTALTPAMRMAFLMNARRIVLLSDGLGNVGGSSGALLRDAREAVRGGVRIDAIGLGDDQDARLLHTLATESGGLYQRL
ncbi:MAG: VWA domain-containing protein [Myxococcales bacterium]|nr:VWA domain-containing protein [Myxococcales bacterium]